LIETKPAPQRDSIRHDQARMLDRLMSALPSDQREVLVLREIEDMGYREIAKMTAVPIGTVMSRLARARAALKARWLKEVGGEAREVR
jgi:RNA polymerase sigma-70 factor (ECF subfamily)